MSDLHSRFRRFDRAQPPMLWGEAIRRAEAAGASERQFSPWLLLLATSLLLLALTAGAVATGLLRLPARPAPLPANTVSVTITDLSGWANAKVAVVLYEGEPFALGQPPEAAEGLASFVTKVDADPSTITGTLLDEPPFPFPKETHAPAAILPAGTHTLLIAVTYVLRPYGTWIPAEARGLWCEVPVTVVEGHGVSVPVDIQSPGICYRSEE